MSKDPNFIGFLHSGDSKDLIDDDAAHKLHRYWVLTGLHQSKKSLHNGAKDPDSKVHKKQITYLRRQIIAHYLKNIILFPIWFIRILTPSFFKGSPSLWTNLKIIATRKEFHPLRMAMISWFVFTYIIIQGGLFFLKNPIPSQAATFTWVQTGWVSSSTNNAAHASDRTGWTQYWDIYPTDVTTSTGTEVTLATVASSTLQTTTGDFDQGTTSTASVTGNGVVLSTGSSIATPVVTSHGETACALSATGAVYCWGDNAQGQLGDGNSTTDSDTPVQVVGVGGSGTLSNIVSLSDGNYGLGHFCAADSSGSVYCWGNNDQGQLGNNNAPTDSDTPVQVLGVGGSGNLSNIVQVEVGDEHSCARDSSNDVYCWGEGGRLGDNTFTQSNVPVQVLGVGGSGNLSNITDLAVGGRFSCAVNTSDNVYCWGVGSDGQLGNNDTTQKLVPVQVLGVNASGNLDNIDVVGAGSTTACAINTSDDIYCWGDNDQGQLGNNNSPTSTSTPVQVVGVGGSGTLASLAQTDGGFDHTCAVQTDGDAYCWGNNVSAQLGDNNSPTDSATPVQVVGVGGSGTLASLTHIAGGTFHSCARDSSNAVYCWGDNSQGALGNNNSPTDSATPVQVVGVGGSGNLNLGAAYSSSGTFTSSIIDTVSSTAYDTVTWTTSTQANTTLTLKVRTGQQADMSDATAWGTCTVIDNTGDDISANNCVTDGDRYIQYQAALATTDTSVTPELQDVTINYTRYTDTEQTLTSSQFDTSDSANILSSIAWSETLPTSDTDIKFQIRTAPDSGGSPGTWTSWLGPTDSSDYYTDPAGGETINSTHTDGSNDQWIQYKLFISSSDGGQTPTLSDVTITYVVNNAPQFSGSGVSASQDTDGSITITYSVLDSDATTDSDGLVTPSFEYSLNNGNTWSNVPGHITESGSSATSTRGLSETTWATSTVIWDARSSIDGQDVSQAKIRVTIDDGEAANNTASSTSAAFTLDLADPTVSDPSIWVVGTTTPATVYHTASDTNSIQYATSLDSAMSGATFSSYSLTSTITLSTDPDTVYTQYVDSLGNTTTIQSATTPDTPANMEIKDISNTGSGDYREFIVWGTVDAPTPGFARYDIYRSTDGTNYSLLATETTRTNNYYLDQSVSANTTYYYKVATVDSDKNTSAFSSAVSDNADGQGGTDSTAPTITSVASSGATTQSFTVTWDTDEVSSSSVAYTTGSLGGSFTTTTVDTMVKSDGSSLGQHSVTITGLSPNTEYFFQVASADPTGNIAFDTNSGSGYSVTTVDGPSISGTTANSIDNNQATITWNTDVSANSTVYYSLSSDLSSSSNVADATLTTSHSITLTGLLTGTTYYYYVTSGDATDNNGASYYNFTTTNDTTAPTISSVTASPIADTTAVVTWSTNEPATTQVLYGTTSGSLDTYSTLSTGLDNNHSVSLSSLTENTTYYYTVASVDGSGNATTSTESSFTTQEALSTETEVVAREEAAEATGAASASSGGGGGFPYVPTDNVAPTITNIVASNISSQSAIIEWETSEAADSIVQFGRTGSPLNIARVDLDSNKTDHSLTINDLLPSTGYTFKVSSADDSGNRTQSEEQSFSTISAFEEIEDLQDFGEDVISDQQQTDAESTFRSLIDTTADIIRRLSGQVSVDTLESGLATQYSTIAELGRLVPLPLIGGQPVVEVGSSYARVYWTTDKPASSLVALAADSTYQNNQEYTQVVGNATEQVENHEVLISELKPSTTYHYQVRSKTPVSDTARSRDFTFTTKEEQAEIITYRADTVSDNEVIFTWTTNIPTDSKVVYIPYGSDGTLQIDSTRSNYDKSVTTLHEVKVNDMEAGLVYQLELSGEDLNGNIISKTISTFSTSEIDAPPNINQVQTDAALLPGDQTAVQAIISWITNEPATSQVFYQKGFGVTDNTVELSQKTPLDPNFVKRHILVITNFEPGSVYQFQVESVDSSGNITRSRTYTLLTPRQKESVFQVIMGNIEETFSWVGQLGL